MELDLMAPSPHAQVALLFCSGIISLILVQAGGKGWAPGEYVFSYQSFVCFFYFFFVLLLDLCSVSVYPHVWVITVITCHRHINQLPSAWESLGTPVARHRPSVSPPSWPFSSRWVESLASSSPVWEGEPLTRPWGAAGSQQVDFQGEG